MSKEKQIIEEMAVLIYTGRSLQRPYVEIAECLYKEGYRKQSEGEWKKLSKYSEPICTICKKSPCQYFGMLPPFCPNCGAKMKGV